MLNELVKEYCPNAKSNLHREMQWHTDWEKMQKELKRTKENGRLIEKNAKNTMGEKENQQ